MFGPAMELYWIFSWSYLRSFLEGKFWPPPKTFLCGSLLIKLFPFIIENKFQFENFLLSKKSQGPYLETCTQLWKWLHNVNRLHGRAISMRTQEKISLKCILKRRYHILNKKKFGCFFVHYKVNFHMG